MLLQESFAVRRVQESFAPLLSKLGFSDPTQQKKLIIKMVEFVIYLINNKANRTHYAFLKNIDFKIEDFPTIIMEKALSILNKAVNKLNDKDRETFILIYSPKFEKILNGSFSSIFEEDIIDFFTSLAYYFSVLKSGRMNNKERAFLNEVVSKPAELDSNDSIFGLKFNYLTKLATVCDSIANEIQLREDFKTILKNAIVYEDDDIVVFRTNSHKLCVTIGKGTRWCVSSDNETGRGHYKDYSTAANLFAVVYKNVVAENAKKLDPSMHGILEKLLITVRDYNKIAIFSDPVFKTPREAFDEIIYYLKNNNIKFRIKIQDRSKIKGWLGSFVKKTISIMNTSIKGQPIQHFFDTITKYRENVRSLISANEHNLISHKYDASSIHDLVRDVFNEFLTENSQIILNAIDGNVLREMLLKNKNFIDVLVSVVFKEPSNDNHSSNYILILKLLRKEFIKYFDLFEKSEFEMLHDYYNFYYRIKDYNMNTYAGTELHKVFLIDFLINSRWQSLKNLYKIFSERPDPYIVAKSDDFHYTFPEDKKVYYTILPDELYTPLIKWPGYDKIIENMDNYREAVNNLTVFYRDVNLFDFIPYLDDSTLVHKNLKYMYENFFRKKSEFSEYFTKLDYFEKDFYLFVSEINKMFQDNDIYRYVFRYEDNYFAKLIFFYEIKQTSKNEIMDIKQYDFFKNFTHYVFNFETILSDERFASHAERFVDKMLSGLDDSELEEIKSLLIKKQAVESILKSRHIQGNIFELFMYCIYYFLIKKLGLKQDATNY